MNVDPDTPEPRGPGAAPARVRGRQRLEQSRDAFYNLVQSSPLGVHLVDGDLRVAQVSAGAQRVFENVHPLLGRDFDEVVHVVLGDEPLTPARGP